MYPGLDGVVMGIPVATDGAAGGGAIFIRGQSLAGMGMITANGVGRSMADATSSSSAAWPRSGKPGAQMLRQIAARSSSRCDPSGRGLCLPLQEPSSPCVERR